MSVFMDIFFVTIGVSNEKEKKIMDKFDEAFAGVVGYAPIKVELKRIVDTIVNPDKYKGLGVNTPNGILIHGNPGLGKTLIANCFVKACGLKAFVIRKDKPDGEFVKAIKSVYDQALTEAPSIVMLDDMDKFVSSQDSRNTVDNAEEMVAVQTCIDDMKGKGVFTIATANSIRNMPESLIRVGRFDKVYEIHSPDNEDAEKIINFYLQKKSLSKELDISMVSKLLVGHSCAEIETIVNEAGIYAGYDNRLAINNDDVVKALMREGFNAPEAMSDKRKKRIREIAYHEAGHTVVAETLSPGIVTLVSVKQFDGDIGGVTTEYSKEEYLSSKTMMENRVITLLGGRAATELVYGDIDIGACSDIRRSREIVNRFVTQYCALGFDKYMESPYHASENIKRVIEDAVGMEINKYYQRAKNILAQNRKLLDTLADALVQKETLLFNEISEIKKSIKK